MIGVFLSGTEFAFQEELFLQPPTPPTFFFGNDDTIGGENFRITVFITFPVFGLFFFFHLLTHSFHSSLSFCFHQRGTKTAVQLDVLPFSACYPLSISRFFLHITSLKLSPLCEEDPHVGTFSVLPARPLSSGYLCAHSHTVVAVVVFLFTPSFAQCPFYSVLF